MLLLLLAPRQASAIGKFLQVTALYPFEGLYEHRRRRRVGLNGGMDSVGVPSEEPIQLGGEPHQVLGVLFKGDGGFLVSRSRLDVCTKMSSVPLNSREGEFGEDAATLGRRLHRRVSTASPRGDQQSFPGASRGEGQAEGGGGPTPWRGLIPPDRVDELNEGEIG